jgi:hypothetical protein
MVDLGSAHQISKILNIITNRYDVCAAVLSSAKISLLGENNIFTKDIVDIGSTSGLRTIGRVIPSHS